MKPLTLAQVRLLRECAKGSHYCVDYYPPGIALVRLGYVTRNARGNLDITEAGRKALDALGQ